VIKCCNTFGVKNWQTLAAFLAGALSCNKKNLERRTQLNEPIGCASEGYPSFLYKILHLLFFLWYELFVHYALRVEKFINMILMRDFLNFSLLDLGDVSPTQSELCRFVSGSQAKHQVSYPVISLLNKFLSTSAIEIMYWQDVIRSSLCSGVKGCGTKHAHNFLFPKSSFRIRRTTQPLRWSKVLLSLLM
jgi:hypothetical protein